MDDSASDGSTGVRSAVQSLRWAIDRYRAHPELLGPFAIVAVLGVVFEASLELLEELYDVERDLTVRVDADVYDVVLSDYVPDELMAVLEELLWLFVVGVVGNAVLTAVVALVAFGIAALLAADTTADRTRTQTRRAKTAADRVPALFVAGLGASVLVGVGLVVFVIPGLYLAVRTVLAAPAIAVDGTGPIDGLRAGWAASNGRVLEVGGLLGLVAVAAVLAGLVPYIGVILVAVGVLPVFALAVTRLYVTADLED